MVTLEMLVGPFSPPWERVLSPPGHKTIPLGDKGLSESLIFSVTTFIKSAFWVPEGLSISFQGNFPLPFVLFPLLIPLSLSLPLLSLSLSISLSYPSQKEWMSSGYSTTPLSVWNLLLLANNISSWPNDKQVGEVCLTPCRCWSREISESDRCSTFISCSG